MRAVSRLGPAQLALTDVAHEVGLAPATLIQRFGSKRGLLLAAAGYGVATIDGRFAELRAAHRSPLEALTVVSTLRLGEVESADALANQVAFLYAYLGDPDFRRLALEKSRRILAGYRALIDDAIAAGELAPTDADRLARSVHAVVGGSLINWAVQRDGALLTWMRDDLDALLAPYRRREHPGAAGESATPRPAAGPRARHKL
jgi:AcrR family transcriptional regulator